MMLFDLNFILTKLKSAIFKFLCLIKIFLIKNQLKQIMNIYIYKH